jgi:hypothetical protein
MRGFVALALLVLVPLALGFPALWLVVVPMVLWLLGSDKVRLGDDDL